GVFVLLAKDAGAFESDAVAFFELTAHLVALAAERDRRIERELAYRTELAEAGQMASLGLLTATVAHELRAPVVALSVQLEEQKRLLERLRDSGSDEDDLLVGELAELLTEMRAAAQQVSSVVSQLSSLSRKDSLPQRLDLAEVASEG